MLEPHDVFTPGKLPINSTNVYALRTKDGVQTRFETIIKRSLIPIVFGEYGVGKTSLARFVFKNKSDENKLVNIESVAGKRLKDVFQRVLEKLGYAVTVKKVSEISASATTEHSAQAKASAGWAEALFAVKHVKSTSGKETEEKHFAVTSPTDSKIIELCEENGIVLMIDELHRALPEFTAELVDFIKAYGNSNCREFKIVLLGTSSEATALVKADTGIDRLIQEVRVRSMDEVESSYIVDEGMKSLGINCSDAVKNRLVKTSVGSPNIIQHLCLDIADAGFKRTPRTVEMIDVEEALKEYVELREARLYRIYMSAIENVGERRYRKQLLRAISECDDEYVTMENLREKVTLYVGEPVQSQALSGPLRDLKEARFGPVLKDVDRPDSDGRISNYTTFVDPSLKAFIRMVVNRDLTASGA